MSESKVDAVPSSSQTLLNNTWTSDNPNVTQWIKNKLEDEGVQARNIIKYNVPVEAHSTTSPRQYQAQCSPRDHSMSNGQAASPCNSTLVIAMSRSTKSPSVHSNSLSASSSSPASSPRRQRQTRGGYSRYSAAGGSSGANPCGRSTLHVESEYRALYWGQMLETLHRTIDEIYLACETDESELECREVIMILEHSRHDFHSLIEKINLLRDYEKADARNKPYSLAWDERNTLPCKPIMCRVLASAAAAAASTTATLDGAAFSSSDWRHHHRLPVKRTPTNSTTISEVVVKTPTNLSLSDVYRDSTGANSESRLPAEDRRLTGAQVDFDELASDEDDDDDVDTTQEEDIYGEDDGEEEEEDNTLSRDLRQLDEAIANVTTVERVLSNQLDRAHMAEAVLRRRLIAEEQQQQDAVTTSTEKYRSKKKEMAGNEKSLGFDARRNLPALQVIDLESEDPILEAEPAKSQRREDNGGGDYSAIVSEPDTDADLFDLDDILDECVEPEVDQETSGADSRMPIPLVVAADVAFSVEDAGPLGSAVGGKDAQVCCTCNCHGQVDGREEQGQSRTAGAPQLGRPVGRPQVPSLALKSCLRPAVMPVGDAVKLAVPKTVEERRHAGKGVSAVQTKPERDCNSCHTCSPRTYGRHQRQESRKEMPQELPPPLPQQQQQQNTVSVSGSAVLGPPHFDTQSLVFLTEPDTKSRVPGRGIQMHEKLSSRAPRRSIKSIQELEQKQARARSLRQQHLFERAERVHELSKKVEEVHLQKRLLLHQRRSCLERRLRAAERKRQAELERRVLKAHDEETKGREIAFIQTLEAEQKQHSILTKHEESRVRLHEIAAERRRRLEEKLCREEAAKGRRRALEASRRARLDALQARWESRAQQVASRAELLEHSRRAAAKAKEHNREVKMASLEEQQRTHIERLRSKIQRKQIDSERRHQETLREISRKAFEMSVLTHTGEDSVAVAAMEPYPIQKWCCACRVLIVSEVSLKSHLHGKQHKTAVLVSLDSRPLAQSDWETFNLEHIVDAPSDVLHPDGKIEQERAKMRRKRARRLRQRMNQRGQQFMKELEQTRPMSPGGLHKHQLYKLIKDARRLTSLPDTGPWVVARLQAMEKTLNSLLRCLSRDNDFSGGITKEMDTELRLAGVYGSVAQRASIHLGLLPVLINFIGLIRQQKPSGTQLVPDRTYNLAFELLLDFFTSSTEACYRSIFSNDVSILVDCLVARFEMPIPSSPRNDQQAVSSSGGCGPLEAVGSPFPGGACTLLLMDCLTGLLERLADDWLAKCQRYQHGGSVVATDGGGRSSSCDHFWRADVGRSLAYTASEVTQRYQDLISYIVSSSLVDLLSARLSNPRQAHWLQVVPQHSPIPSRNPAATPRQGSLQHHQQNKQQNRRFVLSSIAMLNGLLRLLGCLPRVPVKRSNPGVSASDRDHRDRDRDQDRSPSGEDDQHGAGKFSSSSQAVTASWDPPGRSTASDHNQPTGVGVEGGRLNAVGEEDATRLLETVVTTEMFGLVPLLYCLLLDPVNSVGAGAAGWTVSSSTATSLRPLSGSTPGDESGEHHRADKGSQPMGKSCAVDFCPAFPSYSIGLITLQSLKLFNSLAMVSQRTLQAILGGDLTCLLTRHILLNLMTRCVPSLSATVHCPGANPAPANPALPPQPAKSGLAGCQREAGGGSVTASDLQKELLPSGARQTMARPQVRSCLNAAAGRVTGFELPSWADEPATLTPTGDIPTVGSTTAPVANKSAVIAISSSRLKKLAAGEADPQPVSSASQPASDTGQQHRQQHQQLLATAVLHEVVLCIGHLCALNPENQVSLQTGPPPSLLHRLVGLPFDYFSRRPLTDLLYPTLIAFCYALPGNTTLLEAELNPTLLANYIEEHLLQRKMEELSSGTGKKMAQPSDILSDNRLRFEYRFPVHEWESARKYFTK